MNEFSLIIVLLLPVLLIVGIYRLLARITTRRPTKHSIRADAEQVKKERLFRDESEK